MTGVAPPSSEDETAVLSKAASAATQVPSGPRRRPRAPTTPPPTSASTTINSPIEALERDELLRTKRFGLVGIAIALAGGAGAYVLPGDPTATALVLGAVGVAIVAIGFLLSRTSDPVKFRRPSTGLGYFIPAICVTSALPYYGVFSPAPIVLVLGIYFTSLGKSGRVAHAVYAVCAGAQGCLAVLVITGTIRDTGFVRVDQLTFTEQLITQGIVQFVLLGTLVTARMSRRTALLAVGELERAVRTAAHREALLLEAREELERALRSGRGRFSNQMLGGYHLGTVIGRGAMGEVYDASHPGTNQPVAIKLLSQASLGNPQHVLRFLRELRTTIGIESPNVVKVLEVGEQPVPYLVMERLEGKNLAEILRNKRGMSGADVIDMVRQVGAGITAAAAAGIVHRDLKPQNVFLHSDGSWKVLDFGVARVIDHGDTLTAGQIVGTPSYMAPEQASGATVDHGTDLYALAAIAYRALTGQPPYIGGEIAETLYRVVHTAPRSASDLVPELSREVDGVLAIGLAKRPGDRFASALEFADALAAALHGTLTPELKHRGERLMRAGAWKAPMSRASTSRLRRS